MQPSILNQKKILLFPPSLKYVLRYPKIYLSCCLPFPGLLRIRLFGCFSGGFRFFSNPEKSIQAKLRLLKKACKLQSAVQKTCGNLRSNGRARVSLWAEISASRSSVARFKRGGRPQIAIPAGQFQWIQPCTPPPKKEAHLRRYRARFAGAGVAPPLGHLHFGFTFPHRLPMS